MPLAVGSQVRHRLHLVGEGLDLRQSIDRQTALNVLALVISPGNGVPSLWLSPGLFGLARWRPTPQTSASAPSNVQSSASTRAEAAEPYRRASNGQEHEKHTL